MPKISVIVPVYNTEKYLHRCIDSILAQTFTDFELLLIDDGSKDSSGTICDEYAAKDARVRVFHKENGGVSSARNLGLDQAKGEWITFVDSDDWIHALMYKKMLGKAVCDNADVVYCDIALCFTEETKIWKATEYNLNKVRFLNNFILCDWTSLCNVLIKSKLFKSNRIKHPRDVTYCEDFHVSVRIMFHATKISYVPEAFYCYNRVNETSTLHSLSIEDYETERWTYLDIISFFRKEGSYENYAKSLSWRLLPTVSEFVLDEKTYKKFLQINPDSHRFIWSCPYINIKIKIMMWSLSHNLSIIARILLFFRRMRMNIQSKTKNS